MKIIISHDVDHLFWSDHLMDTYIPGFLLRSGKELLSSKISLQTFLNRFNPARSLHNLEPLVKCLQKHNIPATFFWGMDNGLNLSYSNKKARPIIQWLSGNGFEIGVHGIDYLDALAMLNERERMTAILGYEPAGVRNHYLRHNDTTFTQMETIGYVFDSTDYGVKKPYKIGNMWELPISIMDVNVFNTAADDLITHAKAYTLRQLELAHEIGLPFFVVNFHDVYYSDVYRLQKWWFDWLVNHLVGEGYRFVSFNEAVQELNKNWSE